MRRTRYYLIAAGLVFFAWRHHRQQQPAVLDEAGPPPDPATLAVERSTPAAPAHRCDGRVYCSEMRSCEEAEWFLQNCSGMKMDGDHDGVPCETQWCGRR